MTHTPELRTIVAVALWRNEAEHAAPSSVAQRRTLDAWSSSLSPVCQRRWLDMADAALATVTSKGQCAALTAQAENAKVLAERDALQAENARLRAWAPLVASGYEVPIASQVMEEAAIRLAEVEAVRPITDDYMTSETHHPNYILIPADRFAAIRAALEAKS